MLEKVYFPHSLGLMYQAVTQYLGFMGYGDGRRLFANEAENQAGAV